MLVFQMNSDDIDKHMTNVGGRRVIASMGNAGGLALPWLQGKVLVGAGPGQGVAVTAVLCALMFGAVATFRARRPPA